jgi:ubiquinone/menaquinone biosynthesis C-methylase UbiE
VRFFLREIEPHRLWGIDCLPAAIDVCTSTNRSAKFALVAPFPPTLFENDSLDLVFAYSVFSHLSEPAHLAWLGEFQRILKRGGLAILTTRSREYILRLCRGSSPQ